MVVSLPFSPIGDSNFGGAGIDSRESSELEVESDSGSEVGMGADADVEVGVLDVSDGAGVTLGKCMEVQSSSDLCFQ